MGGAGLTKTATRWLTLVRLLGLSGVSGVVESLKLEMYKRVYIGTLKNNNEMKFFYLNTILFVSVKKKNKKLPTTD